MNLVRRKILGSKKRFCFDTDMEIFVISEKHLINKYKIKGDTTDKREIDIPLSLKIYCSAYNFPVLLINKTSAPEYIFNPKKREMKIVDLNKEFVKFLINNYDKI